MHQLVEFDLEVDAILKKQESLKKESSLYYDKLLQSRKTKGRSPRRSRISLCSTSSALARILFHK
jgi:hypothetical protein